MPTEKIETNYPAARRVAIGMMEMKRMRWPPFNKPDEELFPDSKVPEGIVQGSREHALYLLHAVSVDSMRQADLVYKAMHSLTERVGLDLLHLIDRDKIVEILGPFFGELALVGSKSSMSDPINTLQKNSLLVSKKYQKDPRNMCPEKGSPKTRINQSLKNIDELVQYDLPKSALFMKNMVRFGMWDLPRTEIPIKIDRHLTRISLGAGVIDAEKYSRIWNWDNPSKAMANAGEQLIQKGYFTREEVKSSKIFRAGPKSIKALTEVYQEVCKTEGIDAVELDDAKWATGAYNCKMNDSRFCSHNCLVGCTSRPPSDNNAGYFFIEVDKRKHKVHLFS